jgi:hypothetical protein
MLTRISAAAAVFALLTVAAPARAAYVTDLGASVDLNYGSSEQLTGNLDLTVNPFYPPGFGAGANPYWLAGTSLSLNGTPLTETFMGNTGYAGTQDYFAPKPFTTPPGLFDLEINTADTANLTYLDFPGATGGTVKVNSETLITTPLPAALPLFGSAFAGLGGVGWLKRRKVSRNHKAADTLQKR